jgi:hypothetical protein
MKLKKDWSLAHFLYYNVWIIIIGLVLSFLSITSVYYTGGIDFFINAPYSDPMVQVDAKEFVSTSFLVNGENYFMPIQLKGRFLLNSSETEFISQNIQLMIIRFLKMAILVGFFYLLSKILKSIINKNPFDSSNSKKLIIMGLLLIFLSIIEFGQALLITNIFSSLEIEPSLSFNPDFTSTNSIFFGLLIMLLGYVFKEATNIYEEQKLTV